MSIFVVYIFSVHNRLCTVLIHRSLTPYTGTPVSLFGTNDSVQGVPSTPLRVRLRSGSRQLVLFSFFCIGTVQRQRFTRLQRAICTVPYKILYQFYIFSYHFLFIFCLFKSKRGTSGVFFAFGFPLRFLAYNRVSPGCTAPRFVPSQHFWYIQYHGVPPRLYLALRLVLYRASVPAPPDY